ncbi:MAG TPA: hypothetical protein VGG39_02150 [Polyangiaceae bacterium]|jgi:hypothetical protein
MPRAAAARLALFVFAAAACDPAFSITVTVQDYATGRALEGIHVELFFQPNSPMEGSQGDTDSSGTFTGGDVGLTSPPDPYYVQLTPPGGPPQMIEVRGGPSTVRLCIDDAPTAADAGTAD